MQFLRELDSESIDAEICDPPYNKKKQFKYLNDSSGQSKFNDIWEWSKDVHEEWQDTVGSKNPRLRQYIEGFTMNPNQYQTGAFLCYQSERLMEIHRILKSTGSLLWFCDSTASYCMRHLLDLIFGEENFRNEIIWTYGLGGSSPKRYSEKHDTILFYSKTNQYTFHKPRIPATSQRMSGQLKGQPDVITHIPAINNKAKERVKYPTQKPLKLLELLVNAHSNLGDIISDSCSGSGTTMVAALKNGRNCIGMDLNKIGAQKCEKRVSELQEKTSVSYDFSIKTQPPQRSDISKSLVSIPVENTPVQSSKQKIGNLTITLSKKELKLIILNQSKKLSFYLGNLVPTGHYTCFGCFKDEKSHLDFDVDRIQPGSRGGKYDKENAQLLCCKCNRDLKKDKLNTHQLRQKNQELGRMYEARYKKFQSFSQEILDDIYKTPVIDGKVSQKSVKGVLQIIRSIILSLQEKPRH